ncbi:MAG: MotA/TolQ/ExbB proton channel family protein [Parvularculaceae bacterium]
MEYLNPRYSYEQLQAFLASGGEVLFAIMVLTFFMWGFILERLLYWTMSHGSLVRRAERAWNNRSDHTSWWALRYRDRLMSDVRIEASQFTDLVKILVSVVPLLGLLGTVTGMVFVFDIMAVTGTSNARLMASGISRATIPTMAGLFSSVSGVMFTYWLDRFVINADLKLSDKLKVE